MKKLLPIIIIFVLCIIFPIIAGLVAPAPVPAPDKPSPSESPLPPKEIKCLNITTGQVSVINLEDHLVGVLAAEMPADYHIEALKAQAVAARSYILNKSEAPNDQHPEAHICTDSKHCKGWLSEKEAKAKWKTEDRNRNWKKLKSAVHATKGEYMIYDSHAIEACFFASSGGRTENSEDVWGGSRPYLKSVESAESINQQVRTSTVTVNCSHFAAALGISLPPGTVPTFRNLTRTAGGSVAEVEICGKTFKGTQIRSIFGLKSANFTVTADSTNVTFSVLGYGHGVGMSQLGAHYMAESGQKYTEILSHYYTNIQIAKI